MKHLYILLFLIFLFPAVSIAQIRKAIELTSISVSGEDGQMVLLDSAKNKELSIDYDQASKLKFDYRTRDLEPSEEVRYTLEGFEKGWNKETSGSISFNNLDAGNYILRIGIFKGKQLANEYILPLMIRPAYWQTVWFQILIPLALILLIRQFIKLRARGNQNPYTKDSTERH